MSDKSWTEFFSNKYKVVPFSWLNSIFFRKCATHSKMLIRLCDYWQLCFNKIKKVEITFLFLQCILSVSQHFLVKFPFLLMLIVHLFTPKYNRTMNGEQNKLRKPNLCTPSTHTTYIHRQCKEKFENFPGTILFLLLYINNTQKLFETFWSRVPLCRLFIQHVHITALNFWQKFEEEESK